MVPKIRIFVTGLAGNYGKRKKAKWAETGFFPFSVISGQSGHGNPDFLVPLESLGQVQSAGTLQMSVGAPVESQWSKTGKPVFRL